MPQASFTMYMKVIVDKQNTSMEGGICSGAEVPQ